MNTLALVLNAVLACFQSLARALALWQSERERDAGRTEAERDALEREVSDARTRTEIENEIHLLDDVELARRLREWQRE